MYVTISSSLHSPIVSHALLAEESIEEGMEGESIV